MTISPAIRRITIAAVAGVALVAATVNFLHVQILTASVGESWRSWLEPLPVDGLIVAASMTMLVRRRAGLRAGWLVWVSLVGGIAASLAANVAAAEPNLIGRIVAAWPPLALLLSFEMLMIQVRGLAESVAGAELPEPEPASLVEFAPPVEQPAPRTPTPAPPIDLTAAAIEHFKSEAASGHTMTGREIGEQFGRSVTWGCGVIRKAKESRPTFVALEAV